MRVFFVILAMLPVVVVAPTRAKDKTTKIKVDNQAIDAGMKESGEKADIRRPTPSKDTPKGLSASKRK